MGVEGTGPSLTVDGSTIPVVFKACVEQVLVPTLRRGRVVAMDDLLRPTKADGGYTSRSNSEAASLVLAARLPGP
jgi:hypothetical protein